MKKKYVWTSDRIAVLQLLYPIKTAAEIADKLGCAKSTVYQKAYDLCIEKSEEFKQSAKSGRIIAGKQNPAMIATRFKPGQTPWNKGIPYAPGGRSVATRFQKGRPPHEAANYRPIGSLRPTKYGYLEKKVTDDIEKQSARRWVALHRLVWEAANGPVPAGSIVIFKPGMRTMIAQEVTVDRLECITRAENANLNHPKNKDPELAKIYQLKGAITRQINRMKTLTEVHA